MGIGKKKNIQLNKNLYNLIFHQKREDMQKKKKEKLIYNEAKKSKLREMLKLTDKALKVILTLLHI